MAYIRGAVGIYIVALAAVVATLFVTAAFYHRAGTDYPIWDILNWFWAAALLLMLSANAHFKLALDRRGHDSDRGVTREYLETNVLFYASLVLSILFFWNWFVQNWGEDTGAANTLSMWPFINPPLVAVAAASGLRLWRRSRTHAA